MPKLCVIYNSAPHYRKGIFELIDKEFDCIWAVGKLPTIKDLDLSGYRGEVVNLKNKWLVSHFYWQRGALKLAFKKGIDSYLMLGDIYCLTTWIVAFVAKCRRKRVAFWSHGWYGKEYGIKRLIGRLFWKIPSKGFIYNNRSRKIMIDAGMPQQKFATIYNSLDYARQIEIRKGLSRSSVYKGHFGNDNPVLIFIGRLTPVKRLDLLLEAIGRLKERGEDYNVVFVGEGSEKGSLEEIARKTGIERNVWFFGACYDEQKNAKLIYNADLGVSPGNIGLTAIHVLMFGTPAATHGDFKWQGPEFEAIRPGKTGFFFEKDNAGSLADGISNWFKQMAGRRDAIREECHAIIDEVWNPNRQIEIIKEYFN